MKQRRFFRNEFFSKNLLIQRLLRYAVGTVYVLNIGFWRSSTSVFEVGFEKSDSKLVSWHQLALLAAVANSKIFVQKNNRPLQVELENGRSRLQNDFQILESMLRGFIAPASNADVYTSANLSGRGPSICCRRPFCRLKAPLGLSLLRYAPQTRILLCKILVGNTQTLELHLVDAGCFKQIKRENCFTSSGIPHTATLPELT